MAANKNKKGGGNILPLLVIVIIGFLAYKANPEYWQKGKLIEDWKNMGQKEAPVEDVATIPEETPQPTQPEVDPDAILPGSVSGAKVVPVNVNKYINQNDPTYWTMRSKFKTIYAVMPEGANADSLREAIETGIKNNNLKGEWSYSALYYNQSNKKQHCSASIPQEFLCKQCDKKVCLINPQKSEFIVVPANPPAIISKAKSLSGGKW